MKRFFDIKHFVILKKVKHANRRGFALGLLAVAFATNALGCASEGTDHNYYMFSVFNRDQVSPTYLYDIANYWQTYANRPDDDAGLNFYKWNKDDVLKAAKGKKDVEMQTYLKRLNAYIKACETLNPDAWDYPSKQERTQAQQSLTQIANAAKLYKGSKLKNQYALLRMRINMLKNLDQQNITFWNAVASKLPQSMWKEAMRNIYARALHKTGKRQQALDIYANQGDLLSIKSLARNYRNLAGIQSIYRNNANSPMLTYLVQDFVNNNQQTIDSREKKELDKEWMAQIDAKIINKKEALDFISFADKVIAEGKTQAPCLWLSASAMLHYLYGYQQDAWKESTRAISLDGTQRMKDNARAIRLLVSTKNTIAESKGDKTNDSSFQTQQDYSKYLVGEFKWLDEKVKAEEKVVNLSGYPCNHYTEVQERVAYRALHDRFLHLGDKAQGSKSQDYRNMALAMYGMMDAYQCTFSPDHQEGQDISKYPYSSEYVAQFDTLTARQLASYYSFITAHHEDSFEQYVCQSLYRNADFFKDIIGTKYLAEGNFGEAAKWLKDVSLSFINGQPISFYAAKRSYALPYWFNRQKVKDDDMWNTDKGYAKMKENPKLKFCQEMSQLIGKYNVSREGEAKEKLAYDLAVRYYQASCYGDCWYLAHYGKSVNDSARAGEADFAATAQQYLRVSKESSDLTLRYHSLYALSSIGFDPWYKVVYDDNYNESTLLCRQSSQYQAMQELSKFAKEHPQAVDSYTTKCDVLKAFEEKTRWQN